MARLTKSTLVIFTPLQDTPDVYETWESVSLLLIESITHLDAAVA